MEPTDARADLRCRFIPASPAQVFAAMRDPDRIARWWGPEGFTNTIHVYEFVPGGQWRLTMHGPDGRDYPNESRFTRLVPDRLFEIEHLNGHHFVLTLELQPQQHGTAVHWRQTFDTAEHYERVAAFVATANAQNLDRLAAEVLRVADTATRTAEALLKTLVLYAGAEAQAGYADRIAIRLEGDRFSVADNGRGHAIDRQVGGAPYLDFVYQHLACPFQAGETGPIQLQGLGTSLAVALCTALEVTTQRAGQRHRRRYLAGELVSAHTEPAPDATTGNTIEATLEGAGLRPSPQLLPWLRGLSAALPGCAVSVNGQDLATFTDAPDI